MRKAAILAIGLFGALSACTDVINTTDGQPANGSFTNMAVAPPRPGRPGQPPPPPTTPRPLPSPTPTPILLPAHTPTPVPATTAVTEVTLGRTLFFDPELSLDRTVSCASCHDPAKGFADGRPVGIGVAGAHGKRNVPTILNAGRQPFQFWDGRALTLEEQALGPIAAADEMALPLPMMVQRLQAKPLYVQQFQTLYRSQVTQTLVARAIASYERTVISPQNDLSDRVLRGDPAALASLTASERAGAGLFRTLNCNACHGGPDARDNRFHNIGVGMDKPNPDLGRFVVTSQPQDRGAFKTPTLRNVADTGPYMHDGSQATLRAVVNHYDRGGIPNLNQDQRIRPLRLSETQKQDLVRFLSVLHGPTTP